MKYEKLKAWISARELPQRNRANTHMVQIHEKIICLVIYFYDGIIEEVGCAVDHYYLIEEVIILIIAVSEKEDA